MTHLIENITKLLQHAGFAKEEVVVSHDEKMGILWFSITASSARVLLSREAEALSALNHIAKKVAEKYIQESGLFLRVVVDVNDIERKKIENIQTIAHMMAERARYFKSSISLDPMSSQYRRIVHEFFVNVPDIETESLGEGRERHVIIRYKESEPL
jgi:spoIIIJ-associated protein